MRPPLALFALCLICAFAACTGRAPKPADAAGAAMPAAPTARAAVLVFSRTAGFRHDSIPTAIATVRALAAADGLRVDATEDAGAFTPARLAGYRAVVFANTTGEVLDAAQRAAFEDFVRAGGGFVGIHSAADSEYTSPWYRDLVGAHFSHHPPGLQTARLRFENASGWRMADGFEDIDHDRSKDAQAIGPGWRVTDEFYDYDRNPRPDVHVIATIDERDYIGGRMGADHPIAWCHARFGGRAWYTGLGHDIALYADARYRAHLARGLRYSARLADDC